MSSHAERMSAASRFSVREAHTVVRDLMSPRMSRYWTEMTLSAAVGWSGAAVAAIGLSAHGWPAVVVAALAWLVASTRPYVYARASTLKLDLEYVGRPPESSSQRQSWFVQEAACAALVWGTAVGVPLGVLPVALPVTWYAVLLVVVSINSMRLLGAHRYVGNDDEMSVVEQMMDTINYPKRRWLCGAWGRVGLRLHALHHLLLGLPYHSWQEAHARLAAALPHDSAYRLTEEPGLLRSVAALWRTARDQAAFGDQPTAQRLPAGRTGTP